MRRSGDITTAYVDSLPKCDFCNEPAAYDAVTKLGCWANMCEEHFDQYGISLGTGKGQRLLKKQGRVYTGMNELQVIC